MSSRSRDLLVVLLFAAALLLWAGVLYQDALFTLPRRDQIILLHERTYFDGIGAWLAHGWSYTRTRVLTGGNHLMFRPLHGVPTFLMAELTRLGIMPEILWGLFWQGFASTVLAWFVWRRLGLVWAGVLGAASVVQYVGCDIVLWPHCSVYWLAFGLFVIGLDALEWNLHRRAALLLTVACFGHEMVVLAVVGLLAVALLYREKPAAIALFVALSIFGSTNLLDLGLHPTRISEDPAEALDLVWSWTRALWGPFDQMGIMATAWAAPFVAELGMTSPWERSVTQMPLNPWFRRGLGAAVLLVLAFLVRAPRGRWVHQGLVLLILCLCFGLSFVRIGMRGLNYLQISNYYHAIYIFLFTALMVDLVRHPNGGKRRILMVMLAGWALGCAASVRPLQKELQHRAPFSLTVVQLKEAIVDTLPRGGCFAGPLDPGLRLLFPVDAPYVLLAESSCTGADGEQPWFLKGKGRGLVLVPLEIEPRGQGAVLVEVARSSELALMAPSSIGDIGVSTVRHQVRTAFPNSQGQMEEDEDCIFLVGSPTPSTRLGLLNLDGGGVVSLQDGKVVCWVEGTIGGQFAVLPLEGGARVTPDWIETGAPRWGWDRAVPLSAPHAAAFLAQANK